MDEFDTYARFDSYARAAAGLGGLEIDEAWWPGVLRHLAVLFEGAALVEAVNLDAPPPAVAGQP